MNKIIENILDVFYPLLKRVISFEVYRYLAVGGICFAINFCIFHMSYYLIFANPIFANKFLNPHFASLLSSFLITLPTGFYLNKHFVFSYSKLKTGNQFFLYAFSTLFTVFASKILLDFFIVRLNWNITLAFLSNVFIIQFLNFFFQKKISFQ